MTDIKEMIEELRARLKAATPGPWGEGQYDVRTNHLDHQTHLSGMICDVVSKRHVADQAVIVSAVNALPALLDHIAELEDRLEGVTTELAMALDVLRRRGDEEAQTWISRNFPNWGGDQFAPYGEGNPNYPEKLRERIAELEGRNATLESFARHIDELFSQMRKDSQSVQLNPLAFGGRQVAKQLEELGDRISSQAREALDAPAKDGGG